MLKLANQGLQWANGGTPTPVQGQTLNAGKTISMMEYDLQLHRATSIPSAIFSLIGQVNNAAFAGVAAEGLLYLGAEISQSVTSDGSQPYEISAKFAQRYIDGSTSLGWNHYFRPETGNWERVISDSGNPVYALGNFNAFL